MVSTLPILTMQPTISSMVQTDIYIISAGFFTSAMWKHHGRGRNAIPLQRCIALTLVHSVFRSMQITVLIHTGLVLITGGTIMQN